MSNAECSYGCSVVDWLSLIIRTQFLLACVAGEIVPILCAASSPLPSQNFAHANDPAGYAGYRPLNVEFFFLKSA